MKVQRAQLAVTQPTFPAAHPYYSERLVGT